MSLIKSRATYFTRLFFCKSAVSLFLLFGLGCLDLPVFLGDLMLVLANVFLLALDDVFIVLDFLLAEILHERGLVVLQFLFVLCDILGSGTIRYFLDGGSLSLLRWPLRSSS